MAMDEMMRALAMKMLGSGALGQAGQAVNQPNRQQQLDQQEGVANGLPQAAPMPTQMPMQPPQQQPNPAMLMRLLQMLRGGQQMQAPPGP